AGGQLGRLDFLAGAGSGGRRRGGRRAGPAGLRRRLVQRALDARLGGFRRLRDRLGFFRLLGDQHLLGRAHHQADGGRFGFGRAGGFLGALARFRFLALAALGGQFFFLAADQFGLAARFFLAAGQFGLVHRGRRGRGRRRLGGLDHGRVRAVVALDEGALL